MRLEISNELTEIRRAADMVEEFCGRYALPEREGKAINVVLDEVLSNVICYAFADTKPHAILVALNYSDGEITVEVEDDGAPFDPTQVRAPTLANDVIERRPGGLGIVSVRSLTNSIEYRRASERNYLVLRRRVEAGQTAPQPSQTFNVSDSAYGAGRVIVVVGRLDSPVAKMARDRLLHAIHDGPDRFAVDLSHVPYVSSAGIWALLAADYLATARGGGLVLFGLNHDVRQLFERTGIIGTLRVCDTAEEALATLQPAAPP